MYLRPSDGITMNRRRVLADDKARALAMAKDYKAPDRVVVRDELPLTPGMKVDKPALRAIFDAAIAANAKTGA